MYITNTFHQTNASLHKYGKNDTKPQTFEC